MIQTIFSITDVGKVCGVSPRTASKWFDTGLLGGYRIPTPRRDRRIPREDLLKFLKDHDLPMWQGLFTEKICRILLIGCDPYLNATKMYFMAGGSMADIISSTFEAGMRIEAFRPHCVILDETIGVQTCMDIAQHIRRMPNHAETVLIAIVDDEHTAKIDHSIFNDVFKKPFDPRLLMERTYRLISPQLEERPSP